MALTAAERRARNAVYQARWRAKRDALARGNPVVWERELVREVARCGELSARDRGALADALVDLARAWLRRSRAVAALARKVREG